jgi:hypothetical protein
MIDEQDLRIMVQWYRRPMSATATHLPTGLVTTFADEFSGNMSQQECVDKAVAQLEKLLATRLTGSD